jgi:hypothetical protein
MQLRFRSCWFASLCLLVVPVSALAQEEASLDRVWARLKRAETLTITDASGRELRGTILDRSSTSLLLQQNGHLLSIPLDDIRKIERKKGVSGEHGAAIGAMVGAGIAVLMAEANGTLKREEGPMTYFAGVGLMTAIGIAAGAGLAAATNHQEVLFTRATSVAKLTVAPIVGPNRQGIRLALRF